MVIYAGETIVLGGRLYEENGKPLTPQPSVGVTVEVLDDAELVTILAATAATRQNRDTGTATGGAAKSLTDSSKAWKVNQWVGLLLRILTGTGSVAERVIASNTATTITVEEGTLAGQGAWTTNPAAGSTYAIHESKYEAPWDSPTNQKDKTVTLIVRAVDAAYTGIEKKKLRLE